MGKFNRIAGEVGRLVEEKNEAYGDAFAQCGAFLRLLYPTGIRPEQYGDALALVRIFDKLKRIATRKDFAGESPYRDIAGYGLLGAATDEAEAASRAASVEAGVVRLSIYGVSWMVARAILDGTHEVAGGPLTPAERQYLATRADDLPVPVP